MKNTLLITPTDLLFPVIAQFQAILTDVYITGNFEEVYALAKCKEIDKLAVVFGGYNYSKASSNYISGQNAAEEIHAVDPSIPILIWNGRDYLGGWEIDIKNDQELYLEVSDYEDRFFGITKEYFDKVLTSASIPVRACRNLLRIVV